MKFALFLIAAGTLNAQQFGVFDNAVFVGGGSNQGKVQFDASAGEYQVTGGGANIWGTSDAFFYVYKQMSGDVALSADVRFIGEGKIAHRKACLMIRKSLDSGSAYADVAWHGDGLTSLQYRPTADAATQEIRSDLKAPLHLRIEKRGERFMILAGSSERDMKPTGPATVVLADPIYVGLAVSSHDADVYETAIFSNVKLEPLARPKYGSKISIFDLRTRKANVLYESEATFEAPNWSLDGKYLLVNSGGRLMRLPTTGGEPTPLALDPALRCNNDHGFSPDGKQIAFSASSPQSRQSQVYVASVDGTNPKLVVSPTPSYFHGWSPDGKYLAVIAQRNGNFDIVRVPVSGGPEERLTTSTGYDDGADYLPDGKWLYFNSDRSGSWDIWRIPPDGAGPNDGKAQQITTDELEDWFPHPSPDGKHLVFLSFPKGTSGHNDKLQVQLRMTGIPGNTDKPETLLTFFGGQGTINVNSWSPDSTRFAFVQYVER